MKTRDKWEIGTVVFFILLFVVIAYYSSNTDTNIDATNYSAASYSVTAPDINTEWGVR